MSDNDSDSGLFLSVEALAALRQVVDLPSQFRQETGKDNETDDVQKLLLQLGVGARASDTDSDDDGDQDGEYQSSGFDYAAYYAEQRNDTTLKGNLSKVALIQVDDSYLEQCVCKSFEMHPDWKVYTDPSQVPATETVGYHWAEYEHIDWESPRLLNEEQIYSCYFNRKGLIRKDHLAKNIARWTLKRPKSLLQSCTPQTVVIEPSACENGDTALNVIKNVVPNFLYDDETGVPQTVILKPSFTNQGTGIEIVSSEEDLCRAIDQSSELERAGGFVLQHYIDNPLLLSNQRKFHLRVYVLVSGSFTVHVYPVFLALFASQSYPTAAVKNKYAHLTNTCFQSGNNESSVSDSIELVQLFQQLGPELVRSGIAHDNEDAQRTIRSVEDKVCAIIGEVFESIANEATFQTRPNCFELFGFDLMLDKTLNVWLLEANAEPDFKQTGQELQYVVAELIKQVVELTAVHSPYFPSSSEAVDQAKTSSRFDTKLRKVYQHQRFGV